MVRLDLLGSLAALAIVILCAVTFAMTSTVNWALEFNVIILSVPQMYKQNIQRTRLLINRQFPLVLREYDIIAWC